MPEPFIEIKTGEGLNPDRHLVLRLGAGGWKMHGHPAWPDGLRVGKSIGEAMTNVGEIIEKADTERMQRAQMAAYAREIGAIWWDDEPIGRAR